MEVWGCGKVKVLGGRVACIEKEGWGFAESGVVHLHTGGEVGLHLRGC